MQVDLAKAAVREHIIRPGVKKEGSCHLFRHTMATLMLEGGADIRFIQAMLGHASIISTEIYTQVAIRKLKEVYELTHPGAKLERGSDRDRPNDEGRDELLSSLAAEAAEEERAIVASPSPAKAQRPLVPALRQIYTRWSCRRANVQSSGERSEEH